LEFGLVSLLDGLNSMKTIFISALLLVSAGGLLAAITNVNFKIGDVSFTIPPPDGFLPVTDEMVELKKLAETFVAPQNTLLASFIPEEVAPAAQRGEITAMPRTMSIQTATKMLTQDATRSDFADFKEAIRGQQLELMKKVEKEMPGFFDKANQKIKKDFNAEVAVGVGGIVPLPPHLENDRMLAFSMLLNVSIKDAQGKSEVSAAYATSTFLHLRGKLLFVYVYGGKEDLDWTREVSKNWTAAMLAANPPDALTDARESAPSKHHGFDWSQVLRSGLIGGGIGCLIGLFRFISRKKKNNG
jgi:hypothetical protein